MTTAHALGVTAFQDGRLDEAEAQFRSAVAEAPELALNDLAAVYLLQARYELARPLLLRALAQAPADPRARYNLSLLLLAEQRHELGWLLHEARRQVPDLKVTAPGIPLPEWQGGAVAGRRLLVFGEQGLGDQLMFARYLPELRALGADVTYVCSAPLTPLLPDAVAAVSRRVDADAWVLAGSLPLRLDAAARPIPRPAALAVAHRGGGGVGILAQGSPTFVNDRHRSLHGADGARLKALGRDLAPEATGARDLKETAEIVAGLDLVITVDTALAHLAGAMGVPTWVLLPAIGIDWRWQAAPETTPWYPSARLFRQPGPGEWPAVLGRIEAELSGR